MSTFQALILGIVQGITEFLPVSSSGHLMIFQYLLGLQDLSQYLLFDLVCHIGTLAAIFLVFRKEISEGLRSATTIKSIAVGLIPLFPLLLVIKPIKAEFENLDHLGYFYLISAFLLTMGIFSKEKDENKTSHWTQYLWIGMFQALAILPGISRSGATITAALLLGWSLPSAVRYSFLLAIPTIIGGFLYELIKHPSLGLSGIDPVTYVIGFALSFVVGGAALLFLKVLKSKKMLIPFAIYCFLVGIALIIMFHRV
jgi:undecaprenyl-diphosphatase